MSNLVKNLYPLRLRKISHMIGSGYCFLLTTLFNSRKSQTQWTLPSFWGVINVGQAHSLAPCGDKTPISTSKGGGNVDRPKSKGVYPPKRFYFTY
jgi:hypothetical protein